MPRDSNIPFFVEYSFFHTRGPTIFRDFPFIKEYSVNHIRGPTIFRHYNSGILESLGALASVLVCAVGLGRRALGTYY